MNIVFIIGCFLCPWIVTSFINPLDIHEDRFTINSNSKNDFDVLIETNFVRKCGKLYDNKYRNNKINNCPIIKVITSESALGCLKECVDLIGQCRSWNYEMKSKKCIMYYKTIRPKYKPMIIGGSFKIGYTSGDIDAPIRIIPNGIVSKSGTFICSCSDISKTMKLYNPINDNNISQFIRMKKSIPMKPSCLSLDEHCGNRGEGETSEAPHGFHNCRTMNKVLYPKTDILITIAQPNNERSLKNSYYHFLFETLIRLSTLPSVLYQLETVKIQLYNNIDFDQPYYELLSLFESSSSSSPSSSLISDKFIFDEYHADLVIIPSPISCNTPSKHQILSLRTFLFTSQKLITEMENMNKRLFPSSYINNSPQEKELVVLLIDNQIKNHISNMPQLIYSLEQASSHKTQGFKLIKYSSFIANLNKSKLSQLEILSLFSTANIVISPYNHNEILSNMIISPSCSVIIVGAKNKIIKKDGLKSVHDITSSYEHISNMLGFTYHSMEISKNYLNNSNHNNVPQLFIDVLNIIKIVEVEVYKKQKTNLNINKSYSKEEEEIRTVNEHSKSNFQHGYHEKIYKELLYIKDYDLIFNDYIYKHQIKMLNNINMNGFSTIKENSIERPYNLRKIKPKPDVGGFEIPLKSIVFIAIFMGIIIAILCCYSVYSLSSEEANDEEEWRSR